VPRSDSKSIQPPKKLHIAFQGRETDSFNVRLGKDTSVAIAEAFTKILKRIYGNVSEAESAEIKRLVEGKHVTKP
jgi:hypothetical protein